MSGKQGINDKLQGSVATYLRFGGILITKWFIAECVGEFLFKSVNTWQSYKQERGCLMTLRAWPTHCYKPKKVHEIITFLLVTLLNIHRF